MENTNHRLFPDEIHGTTSNKCKEFSGLTTCNDTRMLAVGDDSKKQFFLITPDAGRVDALNHGHKLNDAEGICHLITRDERQYAVATGSHSRKKDGTFNMNRNWLTVVSLDHDNCMQIESLRQSEQQHTEFLDFIVDSIGLLQTRRSDNGDAHWSHLKPKQGGLDIEGIAVLKDRVWLGLRGPVLYRAAQHSDHDHAVFVSFSFNAENVLNCEEWQLQPHIHILPVPHECGVRDLCVDEDGKHLLVLTGPYSNGQGPFDLHRVDVDVHFPLPNSDEVIHVFENVEHVGHVSPLELDRDETFSDFTHFVIGRTGDGAQFVRDIQTPRQRPLRQNPGEIAIAAPEGITIHGGKLWIAYDHNFAGLYGSADLPHYQHPA